MMVPLADSDNPKDLQAKLNSVFCYKNGLGVIKLILGVNFIHILPK